MKPIFEIKNLSKSFDGVKAVDGVSMSILPGTLTSIIGPNGAGKTTLFNLINGFVKQDTGGLHYKGSSINDLPPSKRAHLGIGRLWQDIRLFGNMTVLQNLLVASKQQIGEKLFNIFLNHRAVVKTENQYARDAEQVLQFIQLADKCNTLAKNISYGQQKLVAIGRLMMNEADLILLDEPFAGIDPLMIDKISQTIRSLASEGKTVLMIEHNLPKAMAISDYVYVMDEGSIQLSGYPSDVSVMPELKEIYLGV